MCPKFRYRSIVKLIQLFLQPQRSSSFYIIEIQGQMIKSSAPVDVIIRHHFPIFLDDCFTHLHPVFLGNKRLEKNYIKNFIARKQNLSDTKLNFFVNSGFKNSNECKDIFEMGAFPLKTHNIRGKRLYLRHSILFKKT